MRKSTIGALAATAALLTSLLAGCSGSTVDVDVDSTGGATVSVGGDDSGGDDSTGDDFNGDSEAPDASDLAPTLVSEAPEGSPTITISDTAFDPDSLTIPAGTVVVFTSADGTFHGLIVNELDSVTVADSLDEYYRFDEPGDYLLADELTSATGTITVE